MSSGRQAGRQKRVEKEVLVPPDKIEMSTLKGFKAREGPALGGVRLG